MHLDAEKLRSRLEPLFQENFELFDFELSGADVDALTALDKGEQGRTGPNPDTFDFVPK